MTSSSFNTETVTMEAAASHVREINGRVQGSLSGLLGKLDVLYGTWKGDASAGFHVLKQRWLDDAAKLNDSLMRISEALDKSRTNYAASEEANTTGFSGIAKNL